MAGESEVLGMPKRPEIGDFLVGNHGIEYVVQGFPEDATDYEITGQLVPKIRYVQQTDGPARQAGSEYTRDLDQVLHGTEVIDGQEQPLFTLRKPSTDS